MLDVTTHKFDPISTRDSLAGSMAFLPAPNIRCQAWNFLKAQRDFVPLIPSDEVADVMQPFQKEIDKLETELETLISQVAKRRRSKMRRLAAEANVDRRTPAASERDLDTMMLSGAKGWRKVG
ncbi:MAG: hypothetical protein WKF73_14045 [Nocardioidaceae bacterium]